MGSGAAGRSQSGQQEVDAVLQWLEGPPGRPLRRVRGLAAQLERRAGSLATPGVGGRMMISMLVSNENSTKNSDTTLVQYVGFYSSSLGAAIAVG